MQINTLNLPRSIRAGMPNKGNASLGITSMTVLNDEEFVVGTETGYILRGSTANFSQYSKTADLVQYSNCVKYTYSSHIGSVLSISRSPFKKNFFLTASTDGTINLFHREHEIPVMSWEPGTGIQGISWSKQRCTVFACIATNNDIYIYDLTVFIILLRNLKQMWGL